MNSIVSPYITVILVDSVALFAFNNLPGGLGSLNNFLAGGASRLYLPSIILAGGAKNLAGGAQLP